MNGLLDKVLIDVIEAPATAGTSTLTSDTVDLAGWTGCLFIAKLGDVTSGSVLGLAIHDSEDDTNYDDLEGPLAFTAGASDADNKFLVLDVVRPEKRYLRAVLTRGSQNAVVEGIWAIKYGPLSTPVTQGSDVLLSDTLANPARA